MENGGKFVHILVYREWCTVTVRMDKYLWCTCGLEDSDVHYTQGHAVHATTSEGMPM